MRLIALVVVDSAFIIKKEYYSQIFVEQRKYKEKVSFIDEEIESFPDNDDEDLLQRGFFIKKSK